MPDQTTLLYLYTETPLHAGVGRVTDAAIDLPIQREQATGYPIVRASTLKGALRSRAALSRPAAEVASVFGLPAETDESDAVPGTLVLSDALTLLFPVRALTGIFAWVTSPAMLARFQRDASGHGVSLPWPALQPPAPGEVSVAPDSQLREPPGRLTLEDLTFRTQPTPEMAGVGQWLAEHAFPADAAFAYWRDKVRRDLVLVPEEAFRLFVTHSTDVAARIRIDPRTGAAAEGALWTEEALPVDTLLYAPLVIGEPAPSAGRPAPVADPLRWLQELVPPPLQVGGSRSLGRGLVQVRWAAGGPARAA